MANEYARLTSEVLDIDVEFWVADDICVSCCCFGDILFLNLEDMQIIMDHLDKWIAHYGSKEEVGEAVMSWHYWCIDDGFDEEKNESRSHPRINLYSWLKGLRPEDLKR